jgi:hypothetical protein
LRISRSREAHELVRGREELVHDVVTWPVVVNNVLNVAQAIALAYLAVDRRRRNGSSSKRRTRRRTH